MNNQKLNKSYKVKPRLLKDYQGDNLIIYTSIRAVYNSHIRYVKKHYKHYKVTRDGIYYTIEIIRGL